MRLLSKSFAALLVLTSALMMAPAASEAVEDKAAGLFVNLTTVDRGMAGHALVFAGKALKRGHPVAIFLNHKSVLIAAEGVPHPSFQGKTLAEHLTELATNGAKVIVCQMCMDGHGLTEADLIEGAVRGTPELVHRYLFDPAYKVMSW